MFIKVSLLYQIPRSDCLHHKISNKISLWFCFWVGTFARLFSEVKHMSAILVNLIFSLSAVKYWVLSYRAIIVMLHVWQWNWYELKSSGYIFEYFPFGLIAHKWKARVCVLLLGVNNSVCVHTCGLLLLSSSYSQQWRSRNLLFIAKPQTYSSPQLTLASLCEIYSRETLVEWKKGCHC